ncbi:MAG: hypothetical protein J6K47_02465 [Clostridia bacterium]|nr:hypothetical protein [Clostridia bacterium]
MKKHFTCLTIIILCCLLFVACNSNSTPNNETNQPAENQKETVIEKITIAFETDNEVYVAGKKYAIIVTTIPADEAIDIGYSLVSGNEFASISNNTLTIFDNAKDGEYIKLCGKYKDLVSNELYVRITNYDEQIDTLKNEIARIKKENSSLQSQFNSLDSKLTKALSTYDNYIRRYCSNGRDWDPGTPASVKQQAMRYADEIQIIDKEMRNVDNQIRSNSDNIQSLENRIKSLEDKKAQS